ncbi:ABC transporter ATP-binding protein [Candidatus Uhrbacteria bacterium]|nr:ABC transporter ATP-binding protein [Candidatus Uhrbacteria bacterium]
MIELRSITKTYGESKNVVTVLQEVTCTIADGEFVAIMGPSGSGKSTLMHIIGLLDSPTCGEYILDGVSVASRSGDDLARIRNEKIGFIFQAFNLLPRATVLRNVMLPLIYGTRDSGSRLERAQVALRAAGLGEERWQNRSNQLSGGQMQRVAVARALVTDPAVLLADEPTGNLDTATGDVVLESFQALHDQGNHTIVLITHEQYVAEHAARIISIRDGRIVEDKKNGHRRAVRSITPAVSV